MSAANSVGQIFSPTLPLESSALSSISAPTEAKARSFFTKTFTKNKPFPETAWLRSVTPRKAAIPFDLRHYGSGCGVLVDGSEVQPRAKKRALAKGSEEHEFDG